MTLYQKLHKLGYAVVKFNAWHHRVEDVFDFWDGKKGCHWHDRVTDERGYKPPDQIVPFIQQRLGQPGELKIKVPKEEFVRRLIAIGWTEEEANQAWTEKQSPVT